MNRIWKNSLAILMSLAILLSYGTVFAQNEATDDAPKSAVSEEIENYVKGFGIFNDTEVIDNSTITRTQAADYFVKAAGFDYATVAGKEKTFVDVTDSSIDASEAALMLGIVTVNDEKKFYPDREVTLEEAVAMAVRTMKCEPIAKLRGGYPSGYMDIARESYLLNGTSAQSPVTKADIANIIYNMHNAYMYEIKYEGDRISYKKSAETTVAENLLGVKKYKVNFLATNISEKTLEVEFTSGIKKGTVEKYNTADTVDLAKIGGKGFIYLDEDDDIIRFVEVKKGSDVINDYVEAVNNSYSTEARRVEDLKKLTLKNEAETYDVHEDVAVYYNDKKVTTESYNYVDCFAKVVLSDNEIVRIDFYELEKGGLITYAITEELRFIVAEDTIHWYDMDNFAVLEIYVDGVKVEGLLELDENYVFDYWFDKSLNKMMLVASSRAAYGTVTGYKDNKILLDGTAYEMADEWCNFSLRLDDYIQGESLDELLGQKVTIYFADDKTVRYIHLDTVNTYTNVVRGVVTNAWVEKGTEYKYIKVYHIDDALGEQTYKVADKLKNGSLSFEYAKGVSKDYSGNGFLEFTLNSDNEIKCIDKVDYFGHSQAFTGNNIPDTYAINRMYVGEAKWFVILNLDGEFTVRKVTYNNMMYMHPEGSATIVSDYNARHNAIPQYLCLLGFENAATAFVTTSVITDIQYIDEETSKIVMANNKTYIAENRFIEENELDINMLLEYRATNTSKDPFKIDKIRDFRGDSSTWTDVDTYTVDAGIGLYRADDLIFRNDYVAQFMVNGEPTDTYTFPEDGVNDGKGPVAYRHNRDSFEIVYMKFGTGAATYSREYRGAKTMNLRKGDNIWFHLNSNKQIDYFIFESGPNSYEND